MTAFRLVAALTTGILLIVCVVAPPASAQEPGGAVGRSAQSEATLASGMVILAALNSGLNAKKAKVGDVISAHMIEAVKSTDGRTILPKGTKLSGHLGMALARSKGDGETVLGIVFDKAVLKDGGEVTLNVKVQAIAEPMTFTGGRQSPSADTSTLGTQQTSPMGGGRMGPGSSEGPSGGVGSGNLDSGGGANSELSPRSKGVYGLRGLKLATAQVDNKAMSTVASDGKNVQLDSGTRMLLVTQAADVENRQ
jgi:hypothetical protein